MFFERLLLLCKEKKTNITAVLKQLGQSTSKGTAWRNGTIPNGDLLVMLAKHFHVSVDYLLGLTNIKTPHEIGEPQDHKDSQLIQLIGQLTPEQKQFLIAQMKTMLHDK